MPAPPIDGCAPRSELQELQLKSQHITDEVGFHTDHLHIYFIIISTYERFQEISNLLIK